MIVLFFLLIAILDARAGGGRGGRGGGSRSSKRTAANVASFHYEKTLLYNGASYCDPITMTDYKVEGMKFIKGKEVIQIQTKSDQIVLDGKVHKIVNRNDKLYIEWLYSGTCVSLRQSLHLKNVCHEDHSITLMGNSSLITALVDDEYIKLVTTGIRPDNSIELNITSNEFSYPLKFSNGILSGKPGSDCSLRTRIVSHLSGLRFCDPIQLTEWQFQKSKIHQVDIHGNERYFNYSVSPSLHVVIDNIANRTVELSKANEVIVSQMLATDCKSVKTAVNWLYNQSLCRGSVCLQIKSLREAITNSTVRVESKGNEVSVLTGGELFGVLRIKADGTFQAKEPLSILVSGKTPNSEF